MNGKENEVRLSRLLLVEGRHERDFFEELMRREGKQDVQGLPIGGKTRLSGELRVLVKQPGFTEVTGLAIVRDADSDPMAAFQSVCSALAQPGVMLACPARPFEFTNGALPKVAIGLLPGAGRTGALEDLLIESVQSDPVTDRASRFLDDATALLRRSGTRPPPPVHRLGKATVHAYLATFEEPDRDQGKAALAGVWPFDAPAFGALRALLRAL